MISEELKTRVLSFVESRPAWEPVGASVIQRKFKISLSEASQALDELLSDGKLANPGWLYVGVSKNA